MKEGDKMFKRLKPTFDKVDIHELQLVFGDGSIEKVKIESEFLAKMLYEVAKYGLPDLLKKETFTDLLESDINSLIPNLFSGKLEEKSCEFAIKEIIKYNKDLQLSLMLAESSRNSEELELQKCVASLYKDFKFENTVACRLVFLNLLWTLRIIKYEIFEYEDFEQVCIPEHVVLFWYDYAGQKRIYTKD